MTRDGRQKPGGLVHEVVDRHALPDPDLLQHSVRFIHDG
jgi:hypothetical protein